MGLRLHTPDEDRPSRATETRIQPRPLDFKVCHSVDGRHTALWREWAPGMSGPGGACSRCDHCFARRDSCLLIVPGVVSRAEAAEYSPRALGIDLKST